MIAFKIVHVNGGVMIKEVHSDEFLVDLIIPKEIDGERVISIGAQAFVDRSICTRDEDGIEFCRFEEDKILFESVTVPEGILLRSSAFQNSSVKKVRLPASIVKIPANCFFQSRVEEIDFEDIEVIEDIEEGAFSGCKYLTHFTWPSKCKTLKCCFDRSGITSLDNIENIENVRPYAFIDTNISAITWPSRCHTIPEGCFLRSNIEQLNGIENVSLIKDSAFQETEKLHSFKWPSNCKVVPFSCFMGSGLQEISGIERVTTIEQSAFSGTKIKSFVWPDNCAYIPQTCFSNSNVTELTNLKNIKEVGPFAFAALNLDTVKLSCPSKKITIHESSFHNTKIKCIDMTDIIECHIIKDYDKALWDSCIKVGFDTEFVFQKNNER